MSWGSKGPAIIAALVESWTTALDPTPVRDGPVLTESRSSEVVVVGYINDTTPGVEHLLALGPASAGQSRERITVHSAVIVLNRTGLASSARERAYAIVALIGQTLADDPALGGVVMNAHIADVTVLQQQEKGSGASVTLVVSVACDTFTAF